MVDATYINNNRVRVVENDKITFDTQRPSIILYPESERIVHTDLNLIFPSFIQSNAYFRNEPSFGESFCEMWSTLFWQEWGPNETYHNENFYPQNPAGSIPGPTTRNLPRINLGTVPSESNYLDIRVRLDRYIAPLFFNLEEPALFFPNNQWINLPGGSCPVEFFDSMIRHFDIVRDGNTIYLERYQSVKNAGSTKTETGPGGYPPRNLAVNQSGWNSYSYSTNSEGIVGLNPRANEYLAFLMNRKGPDLNGNKRPSGTNACGGIFPDLSSRFYADIIITPGYYKTT